VRVGERGSLVADTNIRHEAAGACSAAKSTCRCWGRSRS